MSIKINNIILNIDENIELLKEKVSKKININKENFESFKILKESIDARKKDNIKFNYAVEVSIKDEKKLIKKLHDNNVKYEENIEEEEIKFGEQKLNDRPIVVGMGPAGLFTALLLAEKGYSPLVLERGESVENRTKTIEKFWESGQLNQESNVQFGEGGAGTFSDGKLTTRIKDTRCDFVINELIKHGAPEEISYMGKPHIGTDILKTVVKNIRHRIIELGGEIKFNSKLEDIIVNKGSVEAVVVNGEKIFCNALILAIGHSSRDTYEMLHKNKVLMEAKPFAIGVRIEHHQQMINESQYGRYANHPRLKAADYRLTYTSKKTGRGIYSFCMCPGGEVVAAASEEMSLVTNGMSYYNRDKENANSALVVTVTPKDFENECYKFNMQDNGNDYPLIGMEMQRYYEKLAYKVGGGNYIAPVQLVRDFLNDNKSTALGNVNPSYKPGYTFSNMAECLPNYVISSLKEGILDFNNKIKGFSKDEAILTGIETRTSAPVKILRNENLESLSASGLYPCGEGAGFAGGIISAAVDGIKVAESVMKKYKPLN